MFVCLCVIKVVIVDRGQSIRFFLSLQQKMLKSAQKGRQVCKRQDFIVSVLLSRHAERVGVSLMQDFHQLGL